MCTCRAHDGALMVDRFATPMRTPRAEGMSGRDRILAEAANLQVLHVRLKAPRLQPPLPSYVTDFSQACIGFFLV